MTRRLFLLVTLAIFFSVYAHAVLTPRLIGTTVTQAILAYDAPDAIAGVPCQGGCTLTLPAIPGRLVYFQTLYRNAANEIIGRDGIRVVAAEPPFAIKDKHTGDIVASRR